MTHCLRKFSLWLLAGLFSLEAVALDHEKGIAVYPENPSYWQYDGEPILLIGGSPDDNLFQVEGVDGILERLHSLGGNYVRCTMSSRDVGNVKPYLKNRDGLYDLNHPNPEYWEKFERFLSKAESLNIVVQVELWATYDFYWNTWDHNPFNPTLNINYTEESSGLPGLIEHPAQSRINPFFDAVPELRDNETLIRYQKAFVDKICDITLNHHNVLYTIDNETNVDYRWGRYWAHYLHQSARKAGRQIYVTEMWDAWDPSHGEVPGAIVQHKDLNDWYKEFFNPELHEHSGVRFTLTDTESYQFIDVANNNSQKGEVHYQTALWVHNAVRNSPQLRPVNNVKIYGGYREKIWSGRIVDGIERFWRNVFAGHAAVRFHRPPSGIGLNEIAQAEIHRMRQVVNSVNLFAMNPCNEILTERQDNEVYCLAAPDRSEILLYFTGQGQVGLKVPNGEYEVTSFAGNTVVRGENLHLPETVYNNTIDPLVLRLQRLPR